MGVQFAFNQSISSGKEKLNNKEQKDSAEDD
jgi:hypothetical protein